jgi:hypothetical protein
MGLHGLLRGSIFCLQNILVIGIVTSVRLITSQRPSVATVGALAGYLLTNVTFRADSQHPPGGDLQNSVQPLVLTANTTSLRPA